MKNFWRTMAAVAKAVTVMIAAMIGIIAVFIGGLCFVSRPTTYDFGNGAKLTVPWGAVSVDHRKNGNGIAVQSGVNVTVRNDSDEWRTLTVSYRKPNYGILDTHAFEDLAPRSSKTFGAEPSKYKGMHVSISDYAQKKRDEEARKSEVKDTDSATVTIDNPLAKQPEPAYWPKAVKMDFEKFEVDLTKRYSSDETLARMQASEPERGQGKNGVQEYQTRFGSLRVVSTFGRQSINPNGFNSGGMRNDMVQLPNGKWIAGWPVFPNIEGIVEVDESTFVVCDHNVFEMVAPEKWVCVVAGVNQGYAFEEPVIHFDHNKGLIGGRYLEVHRTNESNFGGFLEYQCGGWVFHSYMGKVREWITDVAEEDGKLVLTIFNSWDRIAPKISFDPKSGSFKDM
jgi:hypothetical protein